MSSSDSSVRFVDDTRAVSAVVGAIFMFGILILALTTYQAAIVPQQNAQTEFQHFEDNRDELIEFRNAVSTAGQNNVSQFPSIKLGTQYQSRTFTINPAPPAGTIQTSDSYNITIKETNSGEKRNVSTRFVEYRPGYREISVGSTWYEHSVLYLDEREGGGLNIIEDQNIITSSGKVRITALQNEFESSGTGRTTVELYPKNGSEFPDFDGEVTVELPTRLDEDYWESELGDFYGGWEEYENEEGVNKTVLNVDSSNLEMNTVGIQDEPTEGSINNIPIREGGQRGQNGGDEGVETNPAGPSDVRLVGVSEDGGVTLTFRNSGEDTVIRSGRVSFFTGTGNPSTVVEEINVPDGDETDNPRAEDWSVGDDFRQLDPGIELLGGEDTEVEYVFNNGFNPQQEFFITTLIFNNSQQGTYFVGGEFDPSDPDGDNGDEITAFESVSVSNIEQDQESGTQQTYEFSLDGDLEDSEEIKIDLDDAFVDNQVEYPTGGQSDITLVEVDGSAEYASNTGQEEAEITYTTSDDDSSGDTISIELDGIETSDEIKGNEYDVTFTYEGDISETTTFEIEDD